jgi:hypothetical protein
MLTNVKWYAERWRVDVPLKCRRVRRAACPAGPVRSGLGRFVRFSSDNERFGGRVCTVHANRRN